MDSELADAGLLVIHGVGAHARTSTLKAVVDPLLSRLDQEGLLADISATTVGNAPRTHDALVVRYLTRNPALAGGERQAPARTLVAVEGRWDDTFLESSAPVLMAWSGRHAPAMTWELLRFHARGYTWIFSGLALVAMGYGAYLAHGGENAGGLLIALAILVGLGIAVLDAGKRWSDFFDPRRVATWVGAGTMLVYELQRAGVMLVTFVGMFLLPVVAVTASWLSALPLMNRFRIGVYILDFAQGLVLNGGAADMEAVANNYVTAAQIRTHLRDALLSLESRLRPDATLTVIAHSGGAPLAWALLSDAEIAERESAGAFRYRLITVGAALNWALAGFDCRAVPLDRPLVNHGKPNEADRTYWLNIWSTWDPVPHGPAPVDRFKGWTTWRDPVAVGEVDEQGWRDVTANRIVRNLGGPVPDEHGEYWRNQQEFVPLVVRSIDDEIRFRADWLKDTPVEEQVYAPGNDQAFWSNTRLAMLSALVRVRLIILALPAGALAATASGRRFLTCTREPIDYGNPLTAKLGGITEEAFTKVIGQDLYNDLCTNSISSGLLVAAALALAAYAITDAYTNYCWQQLGRRIRLLPRSGRWSWFAVPVRPAAFVWLPSLVMPVLLYPFGLGPAFWVMAVGNVCLTLSELWWFNAHLSAMRVPGATVRFNVALGRQRHAAQKETPAAESAFSRMTA